MTRSCDKDATNAVGVRVQQLQNHLTLDLEPRPVAVKVLVAEKGS